MKAEEFIEALRHAVRDAAIKGTMAIIAAPPGRSPSEELRKASDWYRALDKDSQQIFSHTINDAVDSAIFGFLCVLDGVRANEDREARGRLELRYIAEETDILNAPDGPMLHDLYNAR